MTFLKTWYDWLLRTVFVGGIMFWSLFGLMQMGVGVEINLPTIEHTFKPRQN